MRVPTFKMHGSKARLRKWLLEFFPRDIPHYCEPFVGRGNVLFAVLAAHPELTRVRVNDKHLPHFLQALLAYDGDFDFIPEDPITRGKYDAWHRADLGLERDLVECVLAYNGNVFGGGVNNTENSLNRHSKVGTIERLTNARALLRGCPDLTMTALDWEEALAQVPPDTFVYLDPPYHGTKTFYPNIDHVRLVEVLNRAEFSWCLSGYDAPVYDHLQHQGKATRTRASCAKANAGASGDAIRKQETLWTNIQLTNEGGSGILPTTK